MPRLQFIGRFSVLFGCAFALGTYGAPTASEAEGYLARARQSEAKGLLKQAIEFTGQAIEAAPRDPRMYQARARLLERTRRFTEADADLTQALVLAPEEAALYRDRGALRLRLGRSAEAVVDLDRFIELRPAAAPHLWERGIALFYVGRYDQARRQFEQHRTVNPADVENAAWHFLCVAKHEGFEKARQKLIPVEGDPRVPMSEIHALFAGKTEADAVLAAAETRASGEALERQRLYARLYLALFFEARGQRDLSAQHLAEAIRRADVGHYMGDVARVHADWLAAQIRASGRG